MLLDCECRPSAGAIAADAAAAGEPATAAAADVWADAADVRPAHDLHARTRAGTPSCLYLSHAADEIMCYLSETDSATWHMAA